jgi:drug/metabolite transporter (DMT)-like permease
VAFVFSLNLPWIFLTFNSPNGLKTQTKAYLFALAAVLLWSSVATAFKIALLHLDYLQLLLVSTGIASLIMLSLLIYEGKLKPALRLSTGELLKAFWRAALNPWLYYLILFKAYSLLPAQEAMTLNYTWPIMLSLLSIPLLKQSIHKMGMLAILLSFAGVMVIASKGDWQHFSFTNGFGDLLALSSSIIWALFWIANLKSTLDQTISLFYTFLFGFVLTVPLVALYSDFYFHSSAGLGAAIYVGFAEMGVTFYLWLKALQLSKRTDQVSQLIFLSPFLSLLFIHLFLHESIQSSTFIGLIFILLGIYLNQRGNKRSS